LEKILARETDEVPVGDALCQISHAAEGDGEEPIEAGPGD